MDIHKDGISISGLTLKYLWELKEDSVEFQLFKEKEELYYKFKNNLVGGPSVIFNHYQEKNKTTIRDGKPAKKVLGFDANALYLYAIGKNMLCGEHQVIEPYNGIIEDVLNNNFFGVIECDIRVPENLRDYFSEMCPIFKNIEITYKDVSDETKAQLNENYKSRKLIGSLFGEKMLFHTDLLNWYLRKGLVVSNITYAVKYEKHAPFQRFADEVSTSRRQGDISPET